MLTLFGSAGSGSAAVELALLRCGLPYRVRRASTWKAGSAHAELGRVKPLGQVAALRMDSLCSGARKHRQKNQPELIATLKRVEARPLAAPAFARHGPG